MGLDHCVVNFLKSGNTEFEKACLKVQPPWGKVGEGIPPTRRQASKWLRKKGIAYKTVKGIV
jgi:hypothetical protein